MRYLSKISDQILCFMSPAQSKAFVWNNAETDACENSVQDYGLGDDNEDRLFTFEITKTNEQEESVISRPGFRVSSKLMELPEATENEFRAPLPSWLMAGETILGFLSIRFLPPHTEGATINETLNSMRLREKITSSSIKIECELSGETIEALIDHGLNNNYRKICGDWRDRERAISKETEKTKIVRMEELKKGFRDKANALGKELFAYLIGKVLDCYPTLDSLRMSGAHSITCDELPQLKEKFSQFLQEPQARSILTHASLDLGRKLSGLPLKFQEQKKRVACVCLVHRNYSDFFDDNFVETVIKDGYPDTLSKSNDLVHRLLSALPFYDAGDVDLKSEVASYSATISDGDFLGNIGEYVNMCSLVAPATHEAIGIAYTHVTSILSKAFGVLMPISQRAHEEMARASVTKDLEDQKREAQKESIALFVRQINSHERELDENKQRPLLILHRFHLCENRWSRSPSFEVSGLYQQQVRAFLEYKINKLEISNDDHHTLQLDTSFIPLPSVSQKNSASFATPLEHRVIHAQLLSNDRILVVVDDQREHFLFYLENSVSIGNALEYSRRKRNIRKDKVGQDILVAYDEAKRTLVLCAPQKLILYIYAFDEQFGSLQSWASPLELATWYNNEVTINQICFVTGTEEILVVDSVAGARIYSLVSQRFRPASISLPRIPISTMSSPDGACALFVFQADDERILVAHHWDTFGATEGVTIPLPENHGSLSVTSFVNRQSIHLAMMNEKIGYCQSLALDITKKSSEFMFKERGAKASMNTARNGNYANNCLIDCFEDVWTRFPVVAAVSRHMITSATRQPKRITFVSDQVHDKYAPYFVDMVRRFEEQSKKPTDGQLRAIIIDARTYPEVTRDLVGVSLGDISRFCAGQWLADLLCLLPIHIAVARDNRFIPLKDGVASAEFERSLLGAEVGRIVDSISFGWYESILRSYMADKPVKVVSSMGEQSVGKSFALNHLMDTSFAGSAMRTTEGVWMSITPTDDALLVALDFEGVHSIERSPQEDALLVLFNTAISNLVLFRNNFALSRDITDLFQSFQASSVILDPTSNPSLFQSTLVIIIKDVVESDKREIVREFSSKFQKIVQQEQGANFISRLHAGRLNIIPWPVIESSQFYALFMTLKRQLDSQKITHPSAGEFLHTLKILMAKLKANDWGAMSQSLSAHRAQSLLVTLPMALEHGVAEVMPDREPLKNLDTDTPIDCPDASFRLYLSSPQIPQTNEREMVLSELRKTWERCEMRHQMDENVWVDELAAYLQETVKLRITHVETWISINLQRFKASNTHVELLQREMANATVDLQANIELCKMTCSHCHLACTLSRRHDPSQQPHDCNTNHQCPHPCDYASDHPNEDKPCSSSWLVTTATTSALLVNTPVESHAVFRLSYRTALPDIHAREPVASRVTKPMINMLATTECVLSHANSVSDYAAVLITFMDWKTRQFISAERTTAAKHYVALGSYTKYTQVSKRLPCVKLIPAGRREHGGPHIHSLDPSPFHFCETRCDKCGYFCTLPRGHPQQEHETSHGSMSKTKWVIEGPDGTAIELNGRRFAANDDGAPMMCNLVCQSMGRHAHIDYCRTDQDQRCTSLDHEHITERLAPNPDQPKDWISHKLYWRRSGFKDPYSRDDQANFAKCNAMCSGPEHTATANQPAQPSYCTLPIFHPPHRDNTRTGLGYVSNDGHLFPCKNPMVLQQAFHVIFVIDRSGSMSHRTAAALPETPVTPQILRHHNNRLGAVYLSLHGFWHSRQTALSTPGSQNQSQPHMAPARRDSYSLILFDNGVMRCFENDFQSTPDNLLQTVLPHKIRGGTNYEAAICETEAVMRAHWSTERSPVVIFLSDGECNISDSTMRTLCRAAISLGKPLSFHAVSFGPYNQTLRRMAHIAREVESTAPRDPLFPANAYVESSYAEALDSVRLAETFLGLADSLKQTRDSCEGYLQS
ncbi:hypothetical protein P691DRAFT_778790 [Macrolepiota fuliginosa MF-IS2]|uniref:VWFA domain-containing protein n=1 Tax=Macrolepiota fuliginosa MF-IS2 TaxID=1400762 RepID=A0A9P5X386_9AGAR|nr:hypothetical protein P691DRAFT_778790 [Macrolepiota fuliginosa MF-IS2]